MYIAVKTVQKKIPVTEDMLMLVLQSIEGEKNENKFRNKIYLTLCKIDTIMTGYLRRKTKTIKKKGTSCQLTFNF